MWYEVYSVDKYSLAFSVSNLGPKSYQRLLSKFGNSEKAWLGTKEEFEKLNIKKQRFKIFDEFRKKFKVQEYIKKLNKENVEFISFLDKDYPIILKKLENPPIGLYLKGNKKLLKQNFSIGVVGTRKITEYGKNVTQSLVESLIEADSCIVSGLALGVDFVAHKAALENNGKTIAVLACGVDCCRPAENYELYSRILKNKGLIISEYPLSSSAFKGTFLARNRIIAALSHGVLVTEASSNSGSLVTANWAIKLEKKVFAVPGPINAQMSKGALSLIRNGAKLVIEAEDILSEFRINNFQFLRKPKIKSLKLSKEEKLVLDRLYGEKLTTDEISKMTNINVSSLSAILTTLELKGIICNENGNWNAPTP